MRSLAIVGDIHGNATALARALDDLGGMDRTAVFLGDYVNRGTGSKQVIDDLIAFKALRPATILLAGNHDVELQRFLAGGSQSWFLSNGGLLTVRSYVGPSPPANAIAEFIRTFPTEHAAFLSSLEPYFEDEDLLISHVGFNPDNPNSRTIEDMVMTSHPRLFALNIKERDRLVVCGHYVQYDGPVVQPNFACIDTGCGSLPGAPLTVLLYPEMIIKEFRGHDD
jgi:serine/threonine protein phosphatase 1